MHIVARNTLLKYSDFNEAFKIHANVSTLQLGAVISHKVKLITFYSKTLTGSQQRYTVTWKELISIIEILKEF